MLDLLSHSISGGTDAGREYVLIPSLSFVAKCNETKAAYKAANNPDPLPPD